MGWEHYLLRSKLCHSFFLFLIFCCRGESDNSFQALVAYMDDRE